MKAGITSTNNPCGQSDVPNPLDRLSLPPHFVKEVWAKARQLASGDNLLVQCPGDSMSWIVQSEKGDRPHFVKPAKKIGGFMCDERCLGYKCSKICSHTVAVALKNENIEGFVKWFCTLKRLATEFNVTALADSDKPVGTGKKRKGISKTGSAHVKSLCSSVPDSVWTYGHSSNASCAATAPTSLCPPCPPEVPVKTPGSEFRSTLASPTLTSQAAAVKQIVSSQQVTRVTPPTVQLTRISGHQNHSSIPGTIQVSNSTVKIGAYQPSPVRSAPNQVLIQQSRPLVESPFWVTFLFGNVSRCNGCPTS